MESPETPKAPRRLVRLAGILAAVGTMVVATLTFSAPPASASCLPSSSDSTCPNPPIFVAKWQAGYFTHASGVPTSQIFAAPAKTHDYWTDRWVQYYNNHPGQQDALYKHVNAVSKRPGAMARVAKWQRQHGASKGTCQFPLTPTCAAQLAWVDTITSSRCGGWYSWPETNVVHACDRFSFPRKTTPITFDAVVQGLHLVACGVSTGAAVVTAVGSGGSAAPLAFAALAVTDCSVTAWEAVN